MSGIKLQSPIERHTKYYADLKGFFSHEQAVVWDFFLSLQNQNGISGNTMEIGVFGGKSAAFMAMHTQLEERAVFVDLKIPTEVRDILDREHMANNEYVEGRSSDLRARENLKGNNPFFRFIHIDGGHSGTELMMDLSIANSLLHDAGVICIDDFFSPLYPQITDAVFRYLAANPYSLTLVLVGLYKGFLVRPLAARSYLSSIDEDLANALLREKLQGLMLTKTTYPDEINCFGLHWGGVDGVERRGPDWDLDDIAY